MKVKRYKRVQKYITFYKNNFGFRPPFQILIDATICQSALQNKVNISEQMPKYLADLVKLVTTVCVVQESEKLSQSLYGAMVVIKQFPIHRCGHEKNPIAANDCIRQLICGNNNAEHYMLASQDKDLTRAVLKSGAVCPLIYMKGNTLVMGKPDESAKEIVRKEEEKCQELGAHEMQVLKKLKKKHDLDDSDTEKKARKRRKGPKGPNPLSCKKRKKTPTVSQSQRSAPKTDNKKKRSRVPKHIKRMFAKIEANISNQ